MFRNLATWRIVSNLIKKSSSRSISLGRRRDLPLLKRGGLIGQDRTDNGIFFLFPELPPNSTAETNPLLASLEKHEYPDFSELTKEDCGAALLKLALDFEASVWSLEEKIRESKEPNIEYLKELEISALEFETVWSLLNTLYICKGNEFISTEGCRKLTGRAKTARSRRFTSEPIYYLCKELSSNVNIGPPFRRLVEKFVLEGKLSGIELTGKSKEHFIMNARELKEKQQQYVENLNEATSRFKHLVVDPKYMGDMPDNELRIFAKDKSQPNRLPWIVRLDPISYQNFMKYCPERALRWNTWLANVSRSTGAADKTISNSIIIEEIRNKRKLQATILGFDNYVQLSMSTKMAGTIENVQSMIATLVHHALPAQKQELEQLQTFAESRGFEYDLQQWDIDFYRRKEAKSLFNIDHDSTLIEYFSYPNVLNYLFKLCSQLFSIEIVQVPNSKTWHPTVEFYKIIENGKDVGSFFIDPYERKGKERFGSWLFGNQSKNFEQKPLATLAFNFPAELYGKPSLLSFSQVETLFQRFGSLLQHLLTRIDWNEVNGQNNIEWDSVRVPDYFLSLWLTNEHVLTELAKHWDTGEALPKEKIKELINWKRHFAGFDLSQELYKCALDIDIHSSTDFWHDIIKSLYPKYNHVPLDKADLALCSFPEIFSGGLGAAYYSSLWSKMLAADIYMAFSETQRNPKEFKEYGKRFRESYLALGGSQHAGEIFRLIRGRDPTPESLINVLGLDKFGHVKIDQKKSEEAQQIESSSSSSKLKESGRSEQKAGKLKKRS